MREVGYEDPLDDDALNWLRVRVATDRGNVIRFTVQYETTIDGERTPIVRYDSAHGRAHRDLYHRDGRPPDKWWLPGNPTLKEALRLGKADIEVNWERYQVAFLEEQP